MGITTSTQRLKLHLKVIVMSKLSITSTQRFKSQSNKQSKSPKSASPRHNDSNRNQKVSEKSKISITSTTHRFKIIYWFRFSFFLSIFHISSNMFFLKIVHSFQNRCTFLKIGAYVRASFPYI